MRTRARRPRLGDAEHDVTGQTTTSVDAASVRPPSTARRTPQWLLQGELAMCPCGCIGKRKKGSFVEKTLDGGAGLLRQVMFGEDVAERPGCCSGSTRGSSCCQPARRCWSPLRLVRNIEILLVGVRRSPWCSPPCRALPVGFFVKRVWLFVPIFTGIVVLPATLSIVTPGDDRAAAVDLARRSRRASPPRA